jgi:hypothetical protein
MILVKNTKKINFKAYDTLFSHFITNMNYIHMYDINDYSSSTLISEWKHVFGNAIRIIINNKMNLETLLYSNQRKEISYQFTKGTGAEKDPKWPNGWSGELFIQNKNLIDQALEILNHSSFYQVSASSANTLGIYYIIDFTYNNKLLNNKNLLSLASKIYGKEALNRLIELGKDKDVAEQILQAHNELGAEKVLEILFDDKVERNKDKSDQVTELEAPVLTKTQKDQQTLEAIAKIETIIGKEALAKITGWHQYISAALSNNQLSASATQVIQIMSNLVNNLEEWLDFGSAYESIDINNQVIIILTQLENWFDFTASGITHVGLPPRHPGFGPDFDPNGGFGGGGQGMIYSGDDGNQDYQPVTLFIGHNATTFDA